MRSGHRQVKTGRERKRVSIFNVQNASRLFANSLRRRVNGEWPHRDNRAGWREAVDGLDFES